jgi:hypothetical protein
VVLAHPASNQTLDLIFLNEVYARRITRFGSFNVKIGLARIFAILGKCMSIRLKVNAAGNAVAAVIIFRAIKAWLAVPGTV